LPDGADRTAHLVHIPGYEVPWAAPWDLPLGLVDAKPPSRPELRSFHNRAVPVTMSFVDCSTRGQFPLTDKRLHALASTAGGESLNPDDLPSMGR
jgi:hypothetical protein